MKLITYFLGRLQRNLFPMLHKELPGPFAEKQKKLVTIPEISSIDKHVRSTDWAN